MATIHQSRRARAGCARNHDPDVRPAYSRLKYPHGFAGLAPRRGGLESHESQPGPVYQKVDNQQWPVLCIVLVMREPPRPLTEVAGSSPAWSTMKTIREMYDRDETPFDHLDPNATIGDALNYPKGHTQFCVICFGSAPPGANPHKDNCPTQIGVER